MNKKVVDFKNIIEELESKKLNIVFLDERGIFLEDEKNNLYDYDRYLYGTYLDKLIKDGEKITFNLIEREISKNVGYLKKDIWNYLDVMAFIERQKIR